MDCTTGKSIISSQAEDQAEIVGNNQSITVPAGAFNNCIKIRETNPLDPSFLEYKYYASGVGLVKVEKIADPVEIEELHVIRNQMIMRNYLIVLMSALFALLPARDGTHKESLSVDILWMAKPKKR